jgi:hypothetical protein
MPVAGRKRFGDAFSPALPHHVDARPLTAARLVQAPGRFDIDPDRAGAGLVGVRHLAVGFALVDRARGPPEAARLGVRGGTDRTGQDEEDGDGAAVIHPAMVGRKATARGPPPGDLRNGEGMVGEAFPEGTMRHFYLAKTGHYESAVTRRCAALLVLSIDPLERRKPRRLCGSWWRTWLCGHHRHLRALVLVVRVIVRVRSLGLHGLG